MEPLRETEKMKIGCMAIRLSTNGREMEDFRLLRASGIRSGPLLGMLQALRSRPRHLTLAGLLSIVGGCGLGLLVSSASGQGPGEPLFGDSGPVIFDFVPVGGESEAKSETISNAGEGVLEITGTGVTDKRDFSIAADGCTGMSLSSGQTCTLSVVFHPAVVGTLFGSLVVSSSHGACKNYVPLAGSGTETQAPATASAASCGAPGGTGTAPGQTVTVKAPTSTPGMTSQSEADTLQIVSPPRCVVAGRHLRLYLRTSKAEPIVLALVYINGHLDLAARGQNLSVVSVQLPHKSLPRYRVQVVANTATSPTLGLIRYFEACRQQRSSHNPKKR